LLSYSTLCAQNDTIWFDQNWLITTKDKADFFRPAPLQIDNGFLFQDFYSSGSLQMRGTSLSSEEEVYEGEIKWYFENGNVFQIVNYSKGVLHGERTVYFESGAVRNKRKYKDGLLEGAWFSFFNNGQPEQSGYYSQDEKHGIWTYYDNEGIVLEKGEYENGFRSGSWENTLMAKENIVDKK
jgi:antitoxin component YwqK of YwqJK toxin-antitoxin module